MPRWGADVLSFPIAEGPFEARRMVQSHWFLPANRWGGQAVFRSEVWSFGGEVPVATERFRNSRIAHDFAVPDRKGRYFVHLWTSRDKEGLGGYVGIRWVRRPYPICRAQKGLHGIRKICRNCELNCAAQERVAKRLPRKKWYDGRGKRHYHDTYRVSRTEISFSLSVPLMCRWDQCGNGRGKGPS